MKICASLGRPSDMLEALGADMVEVRTDILGHLPDTKGIETVVTFRDGFDASLLPEGFSGIVDAGTEMLHDVPFRTISSVHDYDKTPAGQVISDTLNTMSSDISKGAYMVRDFEDLAHILEASRETKKEHVILGMGALGTVTRIRQKILGNSFTFAYVSGPTAPGQLSLGEMRRLGDDCMITGIVGDPLEHSRSPAMHQAAYDASGVNGKYLIFRSPSLARIEDCIRGYDIRGMNVTIPYKESIMGHLDALDADAEKAGAVNTIANESGRLKGYNTDIHGIEAAFQNIRCQMNGKKVLLMGSGGAARACIIASLRNGAEVSITGRNGLTVSRLSSEFGIEPIEKGSADLSRYEIIVNSTPIGMYGEGEYPADIRGLTGDSTVLDMVYGADTGLISEARSKGCRIATGEDMLAMQGARAFEIWTGVSGMFDIMRAEIRS
ncbi:MAG: shikimate dehydrogenase [Candidatus Methanomethylophilaceae archaeon]|jgi:3-dehydroquinate dehydratase/shikimate dehydrogenase|nr:shikimate dehydrogenase [Candidatus Methanomethylophilaceae archaeon]MDD2936095.1 shikimate dehydrogenase [Candidatus Methanomethylophilaceae archaeon]MDD3350877.1 shikimate dehydrogenase [Candidatus Methanomethylophilaceae archaeon]MDD3986635.1 shikimate dehydrogenase [Candidatus Methanomethylophilaceae archaeon]MDD4708463.1 shikimate dehydrogenase [Candidatus Methanomethylophilaceae archaeon]